MMKRGLVVLLAACLAVGCDEDERAPTGPPVIRHPDLERMYDTALDLDLSYPEAAGSPWTTWAGTATVSMGRPNLAQAQLPADLVIGSGFGEGCLEDAEGSYTYDPDTGDLVCTFTMTDGTTFDVAAALVIKTVRTTSGFSTVVEGPGTWTVTPGPNCPAGAFAGGTEGLFEATESTTTATVAAEPEPEPQEPRVRFMLVHLPTGRSTVVRAPVTVAQGLLGR